MPYRDKDAWRANLSIAAKERYKRPGEIEALRERTKKALADPEVRKRLGNRAKNRGSGRRSSLEFALEQMFIDEEISFEAQYRIGKYFVDFAFPHSMLVLEIYGCFWHGCETCGHGGSTQYDLEREAFIREDGWEITIIWEHDLKKDPEILRP